MKLFSVLTLLVAGLLAVPSTASAGLVTIDDFSAAGASASSGIGRAAANNFDFYSPQGYLFAGAFSGGNVTYTMNAGTFGDFGDTFTMGTKTGAGSEYLMTVRNQSNQIIDTFFIDDSVTSVSFSGTKATTASALKFSISNQNASGSMFVGNGGFTAFSAVPEPTSLAMVGLAVGGLALRRRRR